MEEVKDSQIDKDIQQIEQNSTQQKKQQTENQNQQQPKKLMPKKLSYKKVRAHLNPLDDTLYPYPLNPNFVNWKIHYPSFFDTKNEKTPEIDKMKIYTNTPQYPIEYEQIADDSVNGVEKSVDFLDIGCGFGGLLFELGKHYPEKLSYGIEIRPKLVDYIGEKIRALRIEQNQAHNVAVLRSNGMRHLVQYFRKESVERLFFGFPDPHFKAKNYRRRIINTGFLSEYAYILKKGGKIYCITDVPDLHQWHVEKIQNHSQFRILDESELKNDKAYELIFTSSEESQKVDRHNCSKYAVVAEKI